MRFGVFEALTNHPASQPSQSSSWRPAARGSQSRSVRTGQSVSLRLTMRRTRAAWERMYETRAADPTGLSACPAGQTVSPPVLPRRS